LIEKERKLGIDRIPCEDLEREMYYLTEELLEKAGYLHYEISNYAKPGYECRHNLSYWSPEHYVGFGIGAASYVGNVRYKNLDDINQYISILAETEKINLSKILVDVTQLTKENKMEEFMFLGLRRMNGISVKEFYHRFGVNYESVYGTVTKKFIGQDMLIQSGDRIYLSKRGIDVSNSVMCEFLLDE
jgi:oxygen-independent coproporphyrinogen-3 oxidase